MVKGQAVLVVGASCGIGAAVAERCAREGATLLLAARSVDKLQEVAERCRGAGAASCDALRCDVADGASIDSLSHELHKRHPDGLDALMIVSGVAAEKQDILTGDPDEWESMLAINTLAPMRLTRAFAPAMAKRGRGAIVTVGSLAGTFASAGSAPYASSKWGVRGWVLSTYEELRKHGIKTMVIEPGFVATDMVVHNERLVPDKMIKPEDVAEAALLPLHLGPNATPLELMLKCVLRPYKGAA